MHTYLTARIPTTPALALRAGGKKVWGTFPFQESTFLGGPGFGGVGTSSGHLRGFRKNRFAGDASLYANAELRFALAPFQFLIPGEFGVFLAADTGRVFFAGDPDDADKWHTGVGRDCEIEGLAYDESKRALLLMCKDARSADMEGQLAVYHWSIEEKQLSKEAHTAIPVVEFSRHIKEKKFQPSGIERHPVSGNYFIVAARQEAIAEITPGGKVVAVRAFPAQWHRQAEGITFAADGTLIIADEGAGKRARLTLYPVSDRQ